MDETRLPPAKPSLPEPPNRPLPPIQKVSAPESTSTPPWDTQNPPEAPQRASATNRPTYRDASERMKEIRATLPDNEDDVDKFHIDPSLIPPGWSYEYKRKLLVGQEDPSYMNSLYRNGWEEVQQSRHPNILVEQGGMVLMERPKELTDERQAANTRLARNAMRAKEEQLGMAPSGTLPRDTPNARAASHIRRTYEPGPIPD